MVPADARRRQPHAGGPAVPGHQGQLAAQPKFIRWFLSGSGYCSPSSLFRKAASRGARAWSKRVWSRRWLELHFELELAALRIRCRFGFNLVSRVLVHPITRVAVSRFQSLFISTANASCFKLGSRFRGAPWHCAPTSRVWLVSERPEQGVSDWRL